MEDIDQLLDKANALSAQDFKNMSFSIERAVAAVDNPGMLTRAFTWAGAPGGIAMWGKVSIHGYKNCFPGQVTLHAMINRYHQVMRDA